MSTKAHVRFLMLEMAIAALCLIVMFQRQNLQDSRIRAVENMLQSSSER